MIRNKSNIFSVDRGIKRKKNGKFLLQQCSTRIDAVFRPFLIPRSTEKVLPVDSFLKVPLHQGNGDHTTMPAIC